LPGNIEDPEFYQKIFDALPIPIFYRDLQGVYQMCNKAHEEFSGKMKAQIIGQSVLMFTPGIWLKFIFSAIRNF
jgi:PAS domain S-box-containing protein